jgi:Asp/Glu/hydantoin racemase
MVVSSPRDEKTEPEMTPDRPRILVINPNSNPAVTRGISEALDALRFANGPEIECRTLEDGPFGIETQEHIDQVALALRRIIVTDRADAYVIACYSDPGLAACREAASRPVFGINEAAVTTALARGDRFGVIAIAQRSIRRHIRYLRQMGLLDRLAAERSLDMSVAETASGAETRERMIAVGRELKDRDGADVVILGCAGMARHRRAVQDALGIPVVDPTQAAVTMAIGAVQVDVDQGTPTG